MIKLAEDLPEDPRQTTRNLEGISLENLSTISPKENNQVNLICVPELSIKLSCSKDKYNSSSEFHKPSIPNQIGMVIDASSL